MGFNKNKIYEELLVYSQKKEYMKIVDMFKNERANYPNEYRLWMFKLVNEYKNMDERLRDIPLEKLFAIAGDEHLPIEEKINWYLDWISVSRKIARNLFYTEVLPKAQGKLVLLTFINLYCEHVLLRDLSFEKNEVLEIEKIVDTLDVPIKKIDKKEYAVSLLIRCLIDIEEYDEAERMLKKYHGFITYEPKLLYRVSKHLGNIEYFKMVINDFEGDNLTEAVSYYSKLSNQKN